MFPKLHEGSSKLLEYPFKATCLLCSFTLTYEMVCMNMKKKTVHVFIFACLKSFCNSSGQLLSN